MAYRAADFAIIQDLIETVEKRFNGKRCSKTVMINNWINEKEIYLLSEDYLRMVEFKKKYGLDGKFVIIYSGNIGLCYDLESDHRCSGKWY